MTTVRRIQPERWWRTHKLLTASLVAAFAALCLAAANALPLAARALLAALALAAGGVIVEVFNGLPEEERRRVVSRRVVTRTAVRSTLAAIVVSCVCWFTGPMPLPWTPAITIGFGRKLDFIPAAFALLLPVEWRCGFHLYFANATYCFPGPFWWEITRYLRTAITAYALTFTVVVLFARLAFFAARTARTNQVPPLVSVVAVAVAGAAAGAVVVGAGDSALSPACALASCAAWVGSASLGV